VSCKVNGLCAHLSAQRATRKLLLTLGRSKINFCLLDK